MAVTIGFELGMDQLHPSYVAFISILLGFTFKNTPSLHRESTDFLISWCVGE